MWELATNWHGEKKTTHPHTHKKYTSSNIKNVYFGIIYNGQGGGGAGGLGAGRAGGGGGEESLITFWRTSLC